MKKALLLSLITLFAFATFAQQQKRTAYLTIWFEQKVNNDKQHYYYVMNAEVGNALVPEVYDLVIYRSERDLKNKEVDFYHRENDSAKFCFNYFTNPTAGLEYISKFGWQLVSVANEVSSNLKYVNDHGEFVPITNVSTVTKYYLKKETD